MKSPNYLVKDVLLDMESMCAVDTMRDYKTITHRLKTEGSSFLTITLANFGKDFEKSLDQGYVAPTAFCGFHRRGGLPVFLQGFLELVFERTSGALLEEPSVSAIQAIRQFSLMWAKMETAPTQRRIDKAFQNYLQREQIVKEGDKSIDPSLLADLNRVGTMLWGALFADLDKRIYEGSLFPKHGPGSTADNLLANAKWAQLTWTDRLEGVFPAGDHMFSSYRSFLDSQVHYLEPGAEIPVKVIWVPKTQKTPRIIAMEPAHMQYMQQALLGAFVELLAPYGASCFISLNDQVPNQDMARRGSLTGNLATLDLSEASDSVSYEHVRALFRNFPHLSAGIDATRSRKALVPGKGVIRLAKYASMGSATCFPVEALVFSTIVFLGIERSLGRRLTKKDIKSFKGSVRVFGDDIIVPTRFAESVSEVLGSFNYSVNRHKSFWNGKFRESCGGDFYNGQDVRYVKVRRMLPTNRRETAELDSAVSLRNQLYLAGYWRTVRSLDNLLEGLLGDFPAVAETSPALGKISFLPYNTDVWDVGLQRPVVRAWRIVHTPRKSHLEGEWALNKVLRLGRDLPIYDPHHLEFAGRPTSSNTKRGWYHAA